MPRLALDYSSHHMNRLTDMYSVFIHYSARIQGTHTFVNKLIMWGVLLSATKDKNALVFVKRANTRFMIRYK